MTYEQNIRIAARLYEARDTAKTALGDKYALGCSGAVSS